MTFVFSCHPSCLIYRNTLTRARTAATLARRGFHNNRMHWIAVKAPGPETQRLHFFGVVVAEEIVGIPRGTCWILGDEPAAKIDELRIFHGLIKIESRLLHVVLRLVIASGFPVLED